MKEPRSEYYPPRARWYNCWSTPIYCLKYRLSEPMRIRIRVLAISLLIPGYAFFARVRWFGWAVLSGYGLMLLLFLVELGTPLANVVFGLMLALHATSICYAVECLIEDGLALRYRIGLVISVVVIMGGAVYYPFLGQMQAHLFMPIRVNDRVYIAKPFANPEAIRKGARVVYRTRDWRKNDYLMRAGVGIGKVLAEGKGHVEFNPKWVIVNNVQFPRSAFMPVKGTLDVPEKSWFVWTESATNRQKNMSDALLSEMFLSQALVPKDQIIGAVVEHWFWRRMD